MTVVLIVDDHHLIRTGVKNLLETDFADMHVDTAGTVADALNIMTTQSNVDLVLMDFKLPDAVALDGLTRLKHAHPATPVALISGHEENTIIRDALAVGADGFIPKSADPKILIDAVSFMLQVEIFLPRSFLKSAPNADSLQTDPESAKPITLTDRQTDVFVLMYQGLSNKEIARRLDVSESTVKTHVSAILKEFDTTSRTKAIARAQTLGWAQD